MALFESYTINDSTQSGVTDTTWIAMAFTPTQAHTIEKVALKIYKQGTPGTLTVSIQGVTGGSDLPDGIDLCSGTIDGNALSSSSPGTFVDIVMDTNPELSASTKYVIVVKAAGNGVNWRADQSGGTYDGGNAYYSTDSGGVWDARGGDWDAMFEEHGTAAGGGGSGGGMKMTIGI